MTKIPMAVVAATLLTASIALAQVAAPHPRDRTAVRTSNERLQGLIEDQMASEAALTAAERAAVAAVRADLTRNEAQQRAAVRDIRGDYRALTAAMTTKYAAETKALNAELL